MILGEHGRLSLPTVWREIDTVPVGGQGYNALLDGVLDFLQMILACKDLNIALTFYDT